MIAVFYIGEARYQEVSRNNHDLLFQELRSCWPITVYDFTQPRIDRTGCRRPDVSGVVQVWDFYHALDAIPEQVVIKLRTDIWFTEIAAGVVAKECYRITEGELDVSYIGMELGTDYAANYTRVDVRDSAKVQDFAVVADRRGIRSKDSALENLDADAKAHSGNRSFRHLLDEHTRAVTVRTHMPLLRKHYDQPTDWQVTMDFVSGYSKKAQAALAYWTQQRPMI